MKTGLLRKPRLYDGGGQMDVQWYVEYYAFNPATGKDDRLTISKGLNVLKTPEERYAKAKSIIASLSRKLQAGKNPHLEKFIPTPGRRVINCSEEETKKLLLSAIPYVSKSTTHKTLNNYRNYINHLMEWYASTKLNGYHICCLTEDGCNSFLDFLTDNYNSCAKTRNEHLSFFKRAFNYLLRKGKVYENAFEHCMYKKHKKKARVYYRDHLRIPLLEDIRVNEPQLELFIECVYYFLRRINELRLLQLSSINMHEGSLIIDTDIGKTNIPGYVEIPNQIYQRLFKMKLHEYPPDYYLFSSLGHPGPKPVGKNYFYKRFRKIRAKFGLGKEYGLYNWKHTGVIKADRAGIPHKDIQLQGGWTTLAMLDEYMRDFDLRESDNIKNRYPDIKSETPRITYNQQLPRLL